MKSKHKIFLLFAFTVLASGCGKDFLDGAEYDSLKPTTDFSTNKEVDDIVRGGYFNLHAPGDWGLLDVDAFRTIESDEVEFKQFATGSSAGNNRVNAFYERDRNENDFNALTFTYRGGYNTIVSANNVLEIYKNNGGPFNDENKAWGDRITGEAYFLRAFGHFYLARLFAPPYSSDPNKPGIITWDRPPLSAIDLKAKSTLKETYEFIISDLKKAIQLLPEKYVASTDPSTYADRAQKDAARALLAEVYFSMGAPFWTAGLDGDGGALEQVNTILGPNANPKYPLEQTNLKGVFTYKTSGGRSSETIFHVSFFQNNAWRIPRNAAMFSEIASNRRRAFAVSKTVLNTLGWSNQATANLDKRYVNWYKRYEAGQDPTYKTDYVDPYNVWCFKFNVPTSSYVAFRSPEFYLMRATILLTTNNTQARDDLNVLRSRAGLLPHLGAVTQADIDSELLKEMGFEGKRLMFLIAQKRPIPPGVRSGGDIPYDDMSLVRKTPQQELERNSKIND